MRSHRTGRARRARLVLLALSGAVVAVGVLAACVIWSSIGPGHHQTPAPRPLASPALRLTQLTSCAQAAPGSPEQIACQVTASCFKLCGAKDSAAFLTAVRTIMAYQAASDLLGQASFSSNAALTQSQVLGVAPLAADSSVKVQIRSAAGYGAKAPPRLTWIQYRFQRLQGRWQVVGETWMLGDDP